MKAQVYSKQTLIGTANLRVIDQGMGVLSGEFKPNHFYYQNIQKHIWKFWAKKQPDYEKWEMLNFNVQLENGYYVFPVGGYTFSDIEEIKDESITIDIAGVDWHVIDDFFLNQPPKSFVSNGWKDISISRKLAFEQELKKELGHSGFFTKKAKPHPLITYKYSALGCLLDDVIFKLYSSNAEYSYKYAVVHLTWRGKTENNGFPYTEFFKEFEEVRAFMNTY